MSRRGAVVAALCTLLAGCALPLIGARPEARETGVRQPDRAARARHAALARKTADQCYAELEAARVRFERVDEHNALGVRMPVRLLGPLGGIAVIARAHDRKHTILDCRLSLALLQWAPALRAAGFVTLEHYSIYRPRARIPGSGRVSGHARGLAIDAARFHLANGEVLDVLTDWEDRERGSSPCPRRPDETWQSRVLRGVVCEAVESSLFQVVLTPHHDRAHDNHVHLELKPEVDWTYVR